MLKLESMDWTSRVIEQEARIEQARRASHFMVLGWVVRGFNDNGNAGQPTLSVGTPCIWVRDAARAPGPACPVGEGLLAPQGASQSQIIQFSF